MVGSTIDQGRGLESTIGLGWAALPWLQLGVVAGHRISSAQIADPWADQCWFAGVEGAQRLLSLGWGLELWIEESIAGGQLVQRAIEVQDQLVFVPQTDAGAFRFDVAIVLRQAL